MTVIDPNELFLAGEDGEKITVVVKSENTVHMVTYNLDGQAAVMPQTGPQTSRLDFRLDMSGHDPTQLLLVFHFANSGGGGIYRVVIAGDKGGAPFGKLIRQFNVPVIANMYTIDVI